jgi:predicted transcriptional regulator
VSNKGVIFPAPQHSEMANLLSTHREAVNRELNKLVREGLIAKNGHKLNILEYGAAKANGRRSPRLLS